MKTKVLKFENLFNQGIEHKDKKPIEFFGWLNTDVSPYQVSFGETMCPNEYEHIILLDKMSPDGYDIMLAFSKTDNHKTIYFGKFNDGIVEND